MSLEGPSQEVRNPKIESLEKEIAGEELLLRQNQERLWQLMQTLETEKANDPVEIQKKREHMLEQLEGLKNDINATLMSKIATWGSSAGALAAIFGGTEGATPERLMSMGKGALIGAAIGTVIWGVQRIKFELENRKKYQEARGTL